MRRWSIAIVLAWATWVVPVAAQDSACTWDYTYVFFEEARPLGDFVAVHEDLARRVEELGGHDVAAPADDAAARAAICADGGCTGDGPWLVVLHDDVSHAFAYGLVTRHRRRYHLAYVRTTAEDTCGPMIPALEHDGTSWVARVGMELREHECRRFTHEVHFLVDTTRARIASSAVRWVTEGERSTLRYREVDGGSAITGCGTERSASRVNWLRFGGEPVD